jgi:hypothetical protein
VSGENTDDVTNGICEKEISVDKRNQVLLIMITGEKRKSHHRGCSGGSITDPVCRDQVVEDYKGAEPRVGSQLRNLRANLRFMPHEFWCCPPQTPHPWFQCVSMPQRWIQCVLMQREGHIPAWFPGDAVSAREGFQSSVHKTDHIYFQRMTREIRADTGALSTEL